MNESETANQEHYRPVLGVDIGGTQIRAAVLQGAQLLSRVSMFTGENPTPERVLPRVFSAVQQALEGVYMNLEQLAGMGVAMPGPLDNRTGIVYEPPNLPGWKEVPLLEILRQRYPLPMYIENDAHTAGLGEYRFGAGRGSPSMVYITVSTGIGGGVILDGKILEGASSTAAEIGHMTIDMHGERCNCGNIGCLEYLASGTAIARMANEAIAAGQGAELLTFANAINPHTQPLVVPGKDAQSGGMITRVSGQTVALAAEAGIPIAREIVTRAGEALGVGLVNIIHLFNPERIILGGGVTQMGAMLMEPALRVVQERAMQAPRQAVKILLAELGDNVGLIGAGALVYYHQDV